MPQHIFDITPRPKAGSGAGSSSRPATPDPKLQDVLASIPKRRPRRVRAWVRALGIFFAVLVTGLVIAVGAYAYMLWNGKDAVVRAASDFYRNADASAQELKALDFKQAAASLRLARGNLEWIRNFDRTYRVSQVAALVSRALPDDYRALSDVAPLLDTAGHFVDTGIAISDTLSRMKADAARAIFEDQGGGLARDLAQLAEGAREIKTKLPKFQREIAAFSALAPAANLQALLQDHFVEADLWLGRADNFLEALSRYADLPEERHLLVLFQNPSEMRATGGFIGSYADVIISRGRVAAIDVRDIYDPDGQRDEKIVPPKSLQAITVRWGVRDANWFFDFPTSAKKILDLMERSKMYSERAVVFDGAIAVNTLLIEDLLRIAGPIEMPEYHQVIDENNFLTEVQKEVESGPDKYIRGEPKRILKLLAPRLLERMKVLSEDEAKQLFKTLAYRARNKDVQIYFRDSALESFFDDLGVSGSVLETPVNFSGDYLAVVNGNIAGGKTDAVILQAIRVESSIDSTGNIKDYLSVTRMHTGKDSKYPWYRVVNQNYIRIFTPPGTALDFAEGFSKKELPTRSQYAYEPYVEDALVASIEETAIRIEEYAADMFTESGKRVFGFWMNVSPDEERELRLEYTVPRRLQVYDGAVYEFVLEKQSGVEGVYSIKVNAPPGYVWDQSDRSVFEYTPEEPFSREEIRLTMKRRE